MFDKTRQALILEGTSTGHGKKADLVENDTVPPCYLTLCYLTVMIIVSTLMTR